MNSQEEIDEEICTLLDYIVGYGRTKPPCDCVMKDWEHESGCPWYGITRLAEILRKINENTE